MDEDQAVAEFKWYAVHTYSGYEARVKDTIECLASLEGLSESIPQIVIPLEPVIQVKRGKKNTVMRNLMPGYLLVQIEPVDEIFNFIKEIKGVSGFVGGGDTPPPLTEEEVHNVMTMLESKAAKPKAEIKFDHGDQVKVTEGPFANFVGTVDHIDREKNKLSVMVSIFGRPTPVELDVLQVESAS